MVTCPGGPILEIPEKGRFVFERLSPGDIRENDYYEDFRIVPGGRPGTRLLVACPRGARSQKGTCNVGQRALRIWHPRKEIIRLLRECKDGRLHEKRRSQLERIIKDIDRLNKGSSFGVLSKVAHGVFAQDAETLWGRIGQFTVNAVLGTLVSIVVIKLLFPDMLGHGSVTAGGREATTEGMG